MNSLIPATDFTTLWALIAAGTALAIWLEQKYRWAQRLSGPVIALIVAMVLSNTRVMPSESPAYDFVGDWLVPLAIPLLLIRANLREIIRIAGRLFLVFHISSIGTLIGTFTAAHLLKNVIAIPDLAYASGMMAASYIGGGVNFMAVKASYSVSESVSNPLIVADNFVMAFFFVILLAAANNRWFLSNFHHPHSKETDKDKAQNLAATHWIRKGVGLMDISFAFAFAFAILALASLLGQFSKGVFKAIPEGNMLLQMLQVLCTNRYVLITGVTLVFATVGGRFLEKVNGSDELGMYMLMIFLFTLGLPADLFSVITKAPLFFLFCSIIAIINLLFTLSVGWMMRLNLEELLLVVNANLGGAPSAAAMAISTGWNRLVLPGILVGIWGYVIGTPVGIVVVELLKR